MANNIFYCEVSAEEHHAPLWGSLYGEFPPAIYMIPDRIEYNTKIQRCMSYSTRVWVQGPKGGVRLLKDKSGAHTSIGYITKNEELMKQFMWVKLKAEPLQYYT